jgi:hypothetical protein
LGFEQGETPESMQPTGAIFDSCVAGCILFNVFFHSFNADLASFRSIFWVDMAAKGWKKIKIQNFCQNP